MEIFFSFDNKRTYVPHPASFIRRSALAPFGREVYKSKFTPICDQNLFWRLSVLGDIDNIDSFVLKNRYIKNSLGHSPSHNFILKQRFSLLDVYEFARYGKSNDYSYKQRGYFTV